MNGTEMMLNSLFKILGVDPKETIAMVLDLRARVVHINQSLSAINEGLAMQNRLLQSIATKLEVEYERYSDEQSGNHHGETGQRQAAE